VIQTTELPLLPLPGDPFAAGVTCSADEGLLLAPTTLSQGVVVAAVPPLLTGLPTSGVLLEVVLDAPTSSQGVVVPLAVVDCPPLFPAPPPCPKVSEELLVELPVPVSVPVPVPVPVPLPVSSELPEPEPDP